MKEKRESSIKQFHDFGGYDRLIDPRGNFKYEVYLSDKLYKMTDNILKELK